MENLKFQNLGFLGSGSYARVQKAIFNNEEVAVKIFTKVYDKKSEAEFLREVNQLKIISHDNIVKLIAFGKWQDKVDTFNCMVIELADVGSLHHVLHETNLAYTFGHAISWLKQCSDAINYLHSRQPKPTIHRDLKPLNLLLMNGGTLLKVCDFGNACNLKTQMTREKGSACWIAPEQLINENYNEKCDVYSYCICMWEVLVRQKPYFHLSYDSYQIMFGVVRGTIRPKAVSKIPKLLDLLLEQGINSDPRKRPTMQFIFKLMTYLDTQINKEPIKPIVETEKHHEKPASSLTNSMVEAKKFLGSVESVKSTSETIIKTEKYHTLCSSKNDLIDEETSLSNEESDILRNQPGRLSFNHNKLNQVKSLAEGAGSKSKFHRRSKSYGNENVIALINNTNSNEEYNSKLLKAELNHAVETMIYDPIEPLYDRNDSIGIFHEHRKLIKEDQQLGKYLNNLRQQRDQLETQKTNIQTYNELLKQKNILLKENENLKKQLQ